MFFRFARERFFVTVKLYVCFLGPSEFFLDAGKCFLGSRGSLLVAKGGFLGTREFS